LSWAASLNGKQGRGIAPRLPAAVAANPGKPTVVRLTERR
jgi:hypothetical protein